MVKVNYQELIEVVEGGVKRIFSTATHGLEIEIIRSSKNNSRVKRLRYIGVPVSLHYGDIIRAHCLKAEEIVTKSNGPIVISSYFVPRKLKEEGIAQMIEVLNGSDVVATYGNIKKEGIVELRE